MAVDHPQVALKAPDFFIETADGRFSLHQLAARHKNLILTTQDSYRYHPNCAASMAASLKQDYAKILKAGAELVMISPDSLEQHRQYALTLLGEEVPYLFVSDSDLEIARCYGLLREEEHHHGGFYYRSLWILDRDATITHKSVPWEGNADVEEYQKLFTLIASEPGEWRATCGVREPGKLPAS